MKDVTFVAKIEPVVLNYTCQWCHKEHIKTDWSKMWALSSDTVCVNIKIKTWLFGIHANTSNTHTNAYDTHTEFELFF